MTSIETTIAGVGIGLLGVILIICGFLCKAYNDRVICKNRKRKADDFAPVDSEKGPESTTDVQTNFDDFEDKRVLAYRDLDPIKSQKIEEAKEAKAKQQKNGKNDKKPIRKPPVPVKREPIAIEPDMSENPAEIPVYNQVEKPVENSVKQPINYGNPISPQQAIQPLQVENIRKASGGLGEELDEENVEFFKWLMDGKVDNVKEAKTIIFGKKAK